MTNQQKSFLMTSLSKAVANKTTAKYFVGGSLSTIYQYGDIVIKEYAGKDPRGYEKLKKEVYFLQNLPPQVSNHFPKVLEVIDEKEYFAFSTPFYKNLPCLSNSFMGTQDITLLWNRLKNILSYMDTHVYSLNNQPPTDDFIQNSQFYRIDKAVYVLSNLNFYSKLTQNQYLYFNGEKLINIKRIISLLKNYDTYQLISPKTVSFFHGNFHPANILANDKDFILIDPRGEYLGSKDYDMSKMYAHLLIRYDEIHHDMFELVKHNFNSFSLYYNKDNTGKRYNYIHNCFIDYEMGVSNESQKWLKKIRLLAAFHIISFSSYHARKINPCADRVMAYYLCGIKLFNDHLNGKEIDPHSLLLPSD